MTSPEHLAVLCELGYSEPEARFVYLVAIHSGYFTLQQYLDFTGTKKGWSVHQFTSKSTRLGHLRTMTCAYGTALYNLYSRRVYGALDRDSLRNRRRLSSELIRTLSRFWTSFWPTLISNTSKPKPTRSPAFSSNMAYPRL